MSRAKEILGLIDRGLSIPEAEDKNDVEEALEITPDNAKAIGALLKNSSYFGARAIDSEKDLYAIKVSVANNDIVEIFTKKEGGKVVYDKAQIDEAGVKAFIEWFNDKLKDILKKK